MVREWSHQRGSGPGTILPECFSGEGRGALQPVHDGKAAWSRLMRDGHCTAMGYRVMLQGQSGQGRIARSGERCSDPAGEKGSFMSGMTARTLTVITHLPPVSFPSFFCCAMAEAAKIGGRH
ncbi:hypothetical protein NDU88_004239 [Pleurodeles waltl]|uniref:Uncharacterized protein n=1 Tax=Pleurodeles waltl TaxID=8319 RepID=A0AAV7W7U3_PLEWA|nr:hypothetical protein NDU88_004239 [Pleurodeles waltl]